MRKEGKKEKGIKGNNKKKGLFILILCSVIFSFIFIVAQTENTNVVNLITSDVKDFFVEVIKGNVAETISDNKFGENLAVGTTKEDIQSQGGTLIFLESAEIISIISSDTTNDIFGGSNATTIIIFGLDENFTKIQEVVILNSTAMNTSKEYIRVYRMAVGTVGTYGGTNSGTITGTAFFAGTTQIEIPANNGQSKTTHYTVPAGHNVIPKAFRITMDTGKVIDFAGNIRTNANVTSGAMSPIRIGRTLKGIDTPITVVLFTGSPLPEKTDIWATASVSVGTAEVEVDYDFIEYEI